MRPTSDSEVRGSRTGVTTTSCTLATIEAWPAVPPARVHPDALAVSPARPSLHRVLKVRSAGFRPLPSMAIRRYLMERIRRFRQGTKHIGLAASVHLCT
jgi:hypothetical protein